MKKIKVVDQGLGVTWIVKIKPTQKCLRAKVTIRSKVSTCKIDPLFKSDH